MPRRRRHLVTPERPSPAQLVSRSRRILLALVIAALVVALAAATQFAGPNVPSPQAPNRAAGLSNDDVALETPARRIYPYSIVPGGVQNSTDVTRAMAGDATVAAHYADLDPSLVRVEHVSGPQRAYVSYRRGERVYWTSHAIPLHDGEAILTDGVTRLRARCGNKLSDVPQQPVSPHEPDEAAFDQVEEYPGRPMLDLITTNTVDQPIEAGEGDPMSHFLHGPLAPYPAPFGLIGPLDPDDGSGAVIGGPPIEVLPIDRDPIAQAPERDPTGETDPGSSSLQGPLGPLADPIDPGDPGLGSLNGIGDPGDSTSPVPVPEPGTITLVALGLAAAVLHALRRRAGHTTR